MNEQYCIFCGGPTIQPYIKIKTTILNDNSLQEKFKVDEQNILNDEGCISLFKWLDNISVIAFDNRVYHDGKITPMGKIIFSYRNSIDNHTNRKGFLCHTICWNLAGKPKLTHISSLLNLKGKLKHKKIQEFQKEIFDIVGCLKSEKWIYLQDPRKIENNKERIIKIASKFRQQI